MGATSGSFSESPTGARSVPATAECCVKSVPCSAPCRQKKERPGNTPSGKPGRRYTGERGGGTGVSTTFFGVVRCPRSLSLSFLWSWDNQRSKKNSASCVLGKLVDRSEKKIAECPRGTLCLTHAGCDVGCCPGSPRSHPHRHRLQSTSRRESRPSSIFFFFKSLTGANKIQRE